MQTELTAEQIEKLFDKRWNGDKSHNFMRHVVRSFFPISKAQLMWENKSKKPMKCAFLDIKVYSIEEALNVVGENQDLLVEGFKQTAQYILNGGEKKPNPLVEKLGGKICRCYYSAESDVVISEPAMQVLVGWVQNKILTDGKMNFLLKDMMIKENTKATASGGEAIFKSVVNTHKERANNNNNHSHVKSVKPATMSLGDIPALQALKEKLDKE